MRKGTVKDFKAENGYGFVQQPDGGKDVFIHIKQKVGGGDRLPKKGDSVVFESRPSVKGLQATEWMFEDEYDPPVVLQVWSGESWSVDGVLVNLKKFGLEDFTATAVVSARDLQTQKQLEVQIVNSLSKLSGDVISGLDRLRKYRKISHEVAVLRDGVRIGHIDDDGRFHYTGASDLRTALGWIVATGVGRFKAVHGFNLDGVAKGITTMISKTPANSKSDFESHVAKVFPKVGCNRQHYGVEPLLWEVGVRTLPAEARFEAA
jgi:cold shock protein